MSHLPRWIAHSVGRQIIAVTVLALAAVSLLTGWIEIESRAEEMRQQAEQEGRLLTRATAILAAEPMLEQNLTALDTFCEELTAREDRAVYARIERPAGQVVSRALRKKAIDLRWVQEFRAGIYSPGIGPEPGALIGRVVLGISNRDAFLAMLRSKRNLIFEAAATFVLLVLLLAWILGRLVQKPLEDLNVQAGRLGQGDLDRAITWQSSDEFGRLAATLDSMRARLVTSYREIQKQNDRLREVDQLKSSFLAMVSHEMRTPMNGILGFSELLHDSLDGTDAQSMAKIVVTSARTLLRLIDDLLDLTRIEAGRIVLSCQEFDLRALLKQVAALLEPEATRKGLRLTTQTDGAIPDQLYGDAPRIGQVVTNLLGNAVKFTANGFVALNARLLSIGAERVRLQIEVEDTGIGIDAEAQGRLFQAFSQADASITRRYGGTGLGLAISRRLVEMMGGTIDVHSQAGSGSIFRFEIELLRRNPEPDPQPRPAEAAATEPLGPPPRVLVVEDNQINQQLMQHVLGRLGYQVEVASNGAEGLEAVQRASPPFDAILMDCQMPVMDGFEATQRIRALGGDRGATPILALTAHAMADDQEECLAAGMDGFLTKPIQLAELRKVLHAWTRSRVAAAMTAASS